MKLSFRRTARRDQRLKTQGGGKDREKKKPFVNLMTEGEKKGRSSRRAKKIAHRQEKANRKRRARPKKKKKTDPLSQKKKKRRKGGGQNAFTGGEGGKGAEGFGLLDQEKKGLLLHNRAAGTVRPACDDRGERADEKKTPLPFLLKTGQGAPYRGKKGLPSSGGEDGAASRNQKKGGGGGKEGLVGGRAYVKLGGKKASQRKGGGKRG